MLLFANTDWYLYNFRRSLAMTLRAAGHEVVLVSPPGQYGEKLEALGFRWLSVPMVRRSLNPVRELRLVRTITRLIRREQVDLVHCFTIKCAIYGSIASLMSGRSETRPSRVNTVAGLGYVFTSDDWRARVLRPFVLRLLRVALGGERARLILQNDEDAALFQRARLVDSTLVRIIPGSGVDLSKFNANTVPGQELASKIRVLLPARMLWDKGVAEFVEAARLLTVAGRPIEFLLAGAPDAGNPASVPEAILRRWVLEGPVQWLGHVEDMPALFQSVDVVVLPSYREGLPKGLIEAGACALPLITTDVPGCRAVVTHEVDGLLVPVRDPHGLARAIARLQDEPQLRARLGAAARAKAFAVFDERIVDRLTLAVYKELVLPATPRCSLA